MTKAAYNRSDGIIIAFDVTAPESFSNVLSWISSIRENAAPGIPKILVGNKCDLDEERVITKEMAEKVAAENDMNYHDVSAKTNTNIDLFMNEIMEKVFDYKFKEEPKREKSIVI